MNALKKTLAKTLLREDGTISTAKLGSWLATTGGAIIAFPAAAAQAGLTIPLPGWLTVVGFSMAFIGLKIGADGLRNAAGKK
jgi:hypothetical protein